MLLNRRGSRRAAGLKAAYVSRQPAKTAATTAAAAAATATATAAIQCCCQALFSKITS